MYAYLREDDPNIDASLRCIREGLKDLIIGYEIGIRHMNRFPSKSKRGDIKDKSHSVRLSLGAADYLNQGRAHVLWLGEIVIIRKCRTFLALPCSNEYFLELSHGRAFDLNVRVAPGKSHPFFFRCVNWRDMRIIIPADVDASCNCDLSVNYHYLAVVPMDKLPFAKNA